MNAFFKLFHIVYNAYVFCNSLPIYTQDRQFIGNGGTGKTPYVDPISAYPMYQIE